MPQLILAIPIVALAYWFLTDDDKPPEADPLRTESLLQRPGEQMANALRPFDPTARSRRHDLPGI